MAGIGKTPEQMIDELQYVMAKYGCWKCGRPKRPASDLTMPSLTGKPVEWCKCGDPSLPA